MFVPQNFNFWYFGLIYESSRGLNEEIRLLQETSLSLESDVKYGYLTVE